MKKYGVAVLVLSMITAVSFSCKPKETARDMSIKNLKEAITGETTASQKYAAYAKKAKEEGFAPIAVMFEATSKAESIHAKRDMEALSGLGEKMEPINPQFAVKTTMENIKDAIKGESYEIETMYPGFIKTAEEAQLNEVVTSFNYAFDTEKKHLAIYKEALAALEKKDLKQLSATYSVCPKCGNTYSKDVPTSCEICGEAQGTFIVIK
ncbi:MAG: rubrerythrin [Spirochaetae bacterium HGW-Spirochaetae-1]|jgi:rubrerythrin|nr:MAG: rubrerythrin [Spirochaetae bacterium HGW-Spirochaetae-1]